MLFVLIARDAKDDAALERRMANREAHVALCDESLKRGEQVVGIALLDDDGKMCGSLMVLNLPSREALDAWMEKEPYITGKVWGEIEVIEGAMGPSFQHLLAKAA